jgi:CBS domain-containing protein
MLDSDSRLLPVFENGELSGVVTVDSVLEAVQPFLDAATVADAVSTDLVTADPSSTVGDTLQTLREKRITHIPVVEDETAAGILSLYDLTGFTVRATERHSDDASEVGTSEERAGRERDGDAGDARTRLLDRPVRDVMISPVQTIDPSATLDVAVDEMFDIGGSSLVVTDGDSPSGIITKTDVLDALTWDDDSRSVQVYGIELAADIADDEIVAMIDELAERDADLSVLDAVIHLHEGDETRHGQALVRARIRLHTDRGLFIGSGERYGANSALNDARDALEQQLHDERTSDQRTQARNEELWEQRFGWLLEGRN